MNNYLRSCAIGAGHWITNGSTGFDNIWFCPAHRREIEAAFNPQPNDIVKFVDGHDRRGDFVVLDRGPDWIVQARGDDWRFFKRGGDILTVRKLGFPNAKMIKAPLWEFFPNVESTHRFISKGCDH